MHGTGRGRRTLLCAVVLALAAACGDTDQAARPEPGAAATTSTIDDPAAAAASTGAAPVVEASALEAPSVPGDDGTASGPDEPTVAGDGAEAPDRAEATPTDVEDEPSRWEPAMLTIDDVPPGWERVEEPDREDRDDGHEDGAERRGDGRGPDMRICDETDFGGGVEFERADDVAGAVFRAALFGPYATSIAATLPAGQVAELLTDLDRAGRSCRTWVQVDDDGNEAVFTIEPLDVDEVSALADQALGFRIGVTSGGFSFEFDLVLWRHGDTGAGVFHAGTVGSVDRAASLEWAAVVAERMAELV